jgi:ribonuclease G
LPEWLVERGIGETRAALIDDGDILEARVQLEGGTAAGSVIAARLTDTGSNGRNAVAVDECGNEYLLPGGAARASEGARLTVEVIREAVPGGEAWKRPLARLTDAAQQLAPALDGEILPFPAPADRLGDAGWNDLIDEARSGAVSFAGGELRMSPTPAMTLIDVDGYLPPEKLAVAGASHAARAIRRLDIGGSIGIDLPTCRSKTARQQAAAAIDSALPQPFERTAVNGFGFVQIIRPRSRASILELAQDRAAFEARALLRRVAFEPSGLKRIAAHPAVIDILQARGDWIEALARQVGGAVELRCDASLPISGGYAETR